MIDTPRTLADIELYANEAAAIAALQLPVDAPPARLPLPEWAKAPEVVDVGCVTRVRPDDVELRLVEDVALRPGLRYRDLVRHYGRDRLVLDLTDIRPFGHPFHDDVFAILRELGKVGGRLAICGAGEWYVERMGMYRRFIRVVPGSPVV